MGLAKKFKADQINIMGGVKEGNKIYMEEKVGDLRDIAFTLRENPTFDKKEIPTLSEWQDAQRKIISTV